MAKKLIRHEPGGLTRAQRKTAKRHYQAFLKDAETTDTDASGELLPSVSKWPRLWAGGFWSLKVRRPYHRATGYQVASANPFAAADLYDPAGPIIGINMLSGAAFTFDPWLLYLIGLVTSPNLLIQGTLRQGKSFFIKRLVALLSVFGRYAINTSDSKGEHGNTALALGGVVIKLGVFGSPIRINPLERPEQRRGEHVEAYRLRVRAARSAVMQQICGLLNPGERNVTAREIAILDWAISDTVQATGDRPTIRLVWERITSPAYLTEAAAREWKGDDREDLVDGLRRLTEGDLAGMFDTESTVKLDPESPYTVIDTSAIAERGGNALAVTQAVTNAWVHHTISNKDSGRQYFLIREEGWRDMKTVAALEAHQEQLKLSGEYGIVMVLIVHEDGDFDSVGAEGSKERELARSLLRGYANRITFNLPAQTLRNAVETDTFTEAEAAAIASLKRGQFLVKIKAGSFVVDGTPTTTDWERAMFDTDRQMRGDGADSNNEDHGTAHSSTAETPDAALEGATA